MTGHYIERLRAYRNNILRYRRLLETSLTDLERGYIERRLRDERASVEALLREAYPDRLSFHVTKAGADQRATPLELTEFLHPAGAFKHPLDVVDDCDLTLYEKRAILSSWLADHCIGQDGSHSNPSLVDTSVQLEEIIDALPSQAETEKRHHEPEPGRKDLRMGAAGHLVPGRRRHDDLRRTNRC
ncbi:hypothetical protein [Bradyrhizobium japonicum]|uniref:hypothetical protein n=1 Tax=Bradyrhizobium japonicum TaxID=375 RepID=UPI002714582E|nr:hypothetical protein [Bradyrhizobium japonicum]WLB23920.1 hypothetical protein QIH95_49030 [Bradyrhizobium japonicum]